MGTFLNALCLVLLKGSEAVLSHTLARAISSLLSRECTGSHYL